MPKPCGDVEISSSLAAAIGSSNPHTYPTNKIHIHTELPANPLTQLTSHQFSLAIARRMMTRSDHHHAV